MDPNDCDPAIFDDEDVIDYGRAFLTPPEVGPGLVPQGDDTFANYGDLLLFGVTLASTHELLGGDLCLSDLDCTPAGLAAAAWTDYGDAAVHAAVLLLDARPESNTAAATLGLDAVNAPMAPGSPFLFGGSLVRDRELNPWEGREALRGRYGGHAGFVLSRGD